MRILLFESSDKKMQIIEDISYEDLLVKLNDDHGWHEVIDACNQDNCIRVFFDIDSVGSAPNVLAPILKELNRIFKCENGDWAISDGSREGKSSYHILSKKYYIKQRRLRAITFTLNQQFPTVDYSVLCISILAKHELLFFRLPNQHKGAVNKSGVPMKIIQGELKDFIVTHIEGLVEFL
jgi:hypothetical protein